jgi:hypothetical protein
MLKFTSNYPTATGVLEKYKKYVVLAAKRNLSGKHKGSGSLSRSIKGYIDKKFNRNIAGKFTGGSTLPSLTFEFNEYGEFLDQGVKGSRSNYVANAASPYKFGRNMDKKSVPVRPIKKWLASKGLNQKLAYAIAKSIYQKGIKRTLFFSKPFEKRYKPMVRAYHSAVADDMAKNIANQLAKKLKQRNALKK